MDELKEALKKLHKLIAENTEVLEAQKRVNDGNFRSLEEALVQKRIEEGVIAQLENASEQQYRFILSREMRFFRYYKETYDLINPEFFSVK
jgi:hypothetical protein